jgi:flagellar basal body-associated protein FliL
MTVVVESRDEHRHAMKRDLAALLVGVAAVIFALAVTLYVVWKIAASTQATGFDADGVRCYTKADQTVCLKTAEPPR